VERQTLSEEELDHLLSRICRTQPVDPCVADDERVGAALAGVRRSTESGRRAFSGSGEPALLGFGRPVSRRTPRRRRAHRRRWVTVGVAVAAAGAVSLVGVESFGGGGGKAGLSLPLAVSPAAAAQLNRAAHAAAGQPTPGDGQWQYQDVRVEGLQHVSLPGGPMIAYSIVNTQQTWYSPSTGTSRELDTQDGISFPTAQDKTTYSANESAFDAAIDAKDPQYPPTTAGLQMDQRYKGNGSPPPWQTSPPSDPQTLLSELWQRDLASQGIKSAANVKAYLGHKNDDMWMALGDLLNSPIARLRATAYAALSYVPGSKVVGNATDELGRSGIAVSWMPPFPGNGFTYIISPTTGNLLETDLIQGHTYGGDRAGSAVIRWVYLQTGVVDSDTALPGGGSQPIDTTTTTP
jgi:hypothetical protein